MPKIEIYCRDRLDANWSDWFQGLTITPVAPSSTRLADAGVLISIRAPSGLPDQVICTLIASALPVAI